MGFGEQWGAAPFIGTPGPILTMNDELEQSLLPTSGVHSNFPMSTMVYFQFVFASTCVVILAGALLGRMNFTAWMLFVPLWLTFSYTVSAFSLWGGGFLATMAVIDYSGGYVIHVPAGTAGFVAAAWVGPRLKQDRDDFQPNNVLLTLVGAGILWTGLNGFNGGDPFAASVDAGPLLVWTILDIIFYKKPAVIGAVQGMITGLVAITPAAGVVAGWFWLFRNVDDTLGIYHTHTVAGIVGGMMVGVFATVEDSAAFNLTNPGGAIDNNWNQVWLQLVGGLFVIGLNVFVTSVICAFIKYVCRIPLRMSRAHLLVGDDAVHGEDAYAFGDVRRSILHGDTVPVPIWGDGELGIIQSMPRHKESKPDVQVNIESEGSDLFLMYP
ncbi:ammonium transporter AmtB-like domain-containing protein [Lipomyces kononenkoae]|uniref:Ammonium transporter AmtB-like domain-containing protein n=1 Tax=Lipomyces kononenkoae TaxID=34357 RepID=A0ACC3SRW4_LIPKO